MNKRIYVDKKENFQTIAQTALNELKMSLKLKTVKSLKIIQVYDVVNVEEEILNVALTNLFSDSVTDNILDSFDVNATNYFCIEAVIGQYDQRADSAIRGLKILGSKDPMVRSALIYLFNEDIDLDELEKIKKYLINPVENQLFDLNNEVDRKFDTSVKPVVILDGFIELNDKELEDFKNDYSFAMNMADLKHIQNYFKGIKRNPTISEVLALDTYWSDHCRHTTFETHLTSIDYSKSNIKDEIDKAYKIYLELKEKTNRINKPMTLMEMASIQAKFQKIDGSLDDMEVSEEVNACSIEVDVDVNGKDERYLLMYKNETHNHPTEIEPFGGASTCVGGAIRDPLSGRAYVYQGVRITGGADHRVDVEKTRKNKLPQRVIAQKALLGNSTYANQIGAATTYVKEFYYPGYEAKRMEMGAVVGAVKKSSVLRESPQPGDNIIMFGAPTGRDGVGAATGSSKEQTINAFEEAAAEVQKGNAPEERKMLRLFKNEKATKLIKKANDLGAGGVSVAIGELADGVEIDLDKIPVKYAGMNGTDLALSESQERMVVVVASENTEEFLKLCYEESIEAVVLAKVTDRNKLEMVWQNQTVIDIDREFLNTNGVAQEIAPVIKSSNEPSPFNGEKFIVNNSLKESLENQQTTLNYASNQVVAQRFDNTIGRGSVLIPYGGKYQATPVEASTQKIATDGFTNTVSIIAHGMNPEIGLYEPFYAGAYAIVEAVSRLVASGATWQKARLSMQEYFENVTNQPEKFGKPTAALLGALQVQRELNLPALGGKDSMSGTYQEVNVPPTLAAFAINTTKTNKIISPEFKEIDNNVYVILSKKQEAIDFNKLKANLTLMNDLQAKGVVKASMSIKEGGIADGIAKMSYGNNIGIAINNSLNLEDLFYPYYGGFIFESSESINNENVILLGKTTKDIITYNNEVIDIKDLLTKSQNVFASVYPTTFDHEENQVSKEFKFEDINLGKVKEIEKVTYSKQLIENPIVYIPVFMGTNGESDVEKSFEKLGAKCNIVPFNDLDAQAIENSVDEMVANLEKANIFVLAGGCVLGDEPDGAAKYIVNILLKDKVKKAINDFNAREGLIIGLGNGFQALLKSGLLPYNQIGKVSENHPTLFINEKSFHVSKIVNVKYINNNSLWLNNIDTNKTYVSSLSNGQGKFVANNKVIQELFENNQVIAQYVDFEGNPSMDYRFNPNGSYAAIEGIISSDSRIIGKMTQPERYEEGTYLNIVGEKEQAIFESAVAYFRK